MKVTAKMQGRFGTDTDMVWARDTDEIGAMLAVAQLIQHEKDDAPWRPKTLSITIEF